MNDMDDETYWGAANNSADPLTAVAIDSDGDIITIEGKADNAGANEYVYYRKSGLSISTSYYTKFAVRHRTSESSNGLAAQVTVNFSGGGSQQLLGAQPVMNTGWTVTSGTLTSGQTISSIDIYADDLPDALADDVLHLVQYDFILLFRRTLSFPFISKLAALELENVYADLQIPGRVGNISQYLGMNSPTFTLSGDMDTNTDWHGGTTMDGGGLMEVVREMCFDSWEWLTSDLVDCKVTVRKLRIAMEDEVPRTYQLDLKKYDLISGDSSKFPDLQWYGKL